MLPRETVRSTLDEIAGIWRGAIVRARRHSPEAADELEQAIGEIAEVIEAL